MRTKASLFSVLFLCIGVMILAGGCSGGSSTDNIVTLGAYGGTGVELPESTRTLMEAAGIKIVPLDANLRVVDASGGPTGKYPDVLLLIGQTEDAGGRGVGPFDLSILPVRDALKGVYNESDDPATANGHVIILNPTEPMMDALSEQIGESFDIGASGDAKLLFYGRTQANGVVSVIGHIDSSTVATVCSRDAAEESASDDLVDLSTFSSPDVREKAGDYEALRDWILETRSRTDTNVAKAAGTRGEGNNLLERAQTYVATLSSSLWGKAFKINNYVVAVHNFAGSGETDGKDWYYIHQENIHDGSGAGYTFERECCYWYSRIDGDKYWVGGGDVCDCYIESFYVENKLMNGDDSKVVLSEPKPEAINAETTHSTTTSHSFGASVSGGFEEKGAKGDVGLSYGYSCSDSKQFTTLDVNVALETNQKVAWRYEYKRPERSSPWYNLTHPAELSHSTYTPHQMWTWAVDTSERGRHDSYAITFKPRRAGVYTRNSGSLEPRHITQEGEVTLNVALRQPPLLAFEVNALTFDRDGNPTNESKSFANYDVQGNVAMTASDAWFTASLASANNKKQVAITGVQKNSSGSARKATVTLKRDKGESAVLTITQLP